MSKGSAILKFLNGIFCFAEIVWFNRVPCYSWNKLINVPPCLSQNVRTTLSVNCVPKTPNWADLMLVNCSTRLSSSSGYQPVKGILLLASTNGTDKELIKFIVPRASLAKIFQTERQPRYLWDFARKYHAMSYTENLCRAFVTVSCRTLQVWTLPYPAIVIIRVPLTLSCMSSLSYYLVY